MLPGAPAAPWEPSTPPDPVAISLRGRGCFRLGELRMLTPLACLADDSGEGEEEEEGRKWWSSKLRQWYVDVGLWRGEALALLLLLL